MAALPPRGTGLEFPPTTSRRTAAPRQCDSAAVRQCAVSGAGEHVHGSGAEYSGGERAGATLTEDLIASYAQLARSALGRREPAVETGDCSDHGRSVAPAVPKLLRRADRPHVAGEQTDALMGSVQRRLADELRKSLGSTRRRRDRERGGLGVWRRRRRRSSSSVACRGCARCSRRMSRRLTRAIRPR